MAVKKAQNRLDRKEEMLENWKALDSVRSYQLKP
jgi:hypothetical protein